MTTRFETVCTDDDDDDDDDDDVDDEDDSLSKISRWIVKPYKFCFAEALAVKKQNIENFDFVERFSTINDFSLLKPVQKFIIGIFK